MLVFYSNPSSFQCSSKLVPCNLFDITSLLLTCLYANYTRKYGLNPRLLLNFFQIRPFTIACSVIFFHSDLHLRKAALQHICLVHYFHLNGSLPRWSQWQLSCPLFSRVPPFPDLCSNVCHYGSYGKDKFESHKFKFASPDIHPGFRVLPPQCPSCGVVSSWDDDDNRREGHEGDGMFSQLKCSCCGLKSLYYLGDGWEEMSREKGILANGK